MLGHIAVSSSLKWIDGSVMNSHQTISGEKDDILTYFTFPHRTSLSLVPEKKYDLLHLVYEFATSLLALNERVNLSLVWFRRFSNNRVVCDCKGVIFCSEQTAKSVGMVAHAYRGVSQRCPDILSEFLAVWRSKRSRSASSPSWERLGLDRGFLAASAPQSSFYFFFHYLCWFE